jgi:hypothetical protein
MSQCISETNNDVSITAHFLKKNLGKLLMLLCIHGGLFVKGYQKLVPLLECGKFHQGSTITKAVART